MIILYALLIAVSAFIFSASSSFLVLKYLRLIQLEDIPNERSNHSIPTPRGGGLAIAGTLIFFLIASGAPSQISWALAGIAYISFLDDKEGVPALHRLLVHIGASALALSGIYSGLFFQGLLPAWADFCLATLLLAFWINIFNFMDGIDGISGAEAISIGLGIAILTILCQNIFSGAAVDGITLAATCAGFLIFNWHPAKMFMGDVGSIPLGLLSGFILFYLASHGYWEAALILPAYYVTDGGFTLGKRLWQRKKIWEAHSEHAYQQAVRALIPHDVVVYRIIAANIGLILLACLSTREGFGIASIILGYAVAAGLRWHLTVMRPAPEILAPIKA